MNVVLPRLSPQLVEDAVKLARAADGPQQLAAQLPRRVENRTWPATGPGRIADSQLADLRSELLDLAVLHGYPAVTGGPRFDGPAARVLRTSLPMTPHEASHSAVWAYLNYCWLLDISVWRWGGGHDRRHFDGNINRDTFRRLWWRAELFGDSFDLSRLAEDELVALSERPQIPQALVRAVAEEFLADRAATGGQLRRTDVMRDVAKRVLRRIPLIEYAALSAAEVHAEARAAISASIDALGGRSDTSVVTSTVGATNAFRAITREASPQVRRVPSPPLESSADAVVTLGDHQHSARVSGGRNSHRTSPERVAMGLARQGGRVTSAALAQLLHIATGEASYILQGLVQDGALQRRGRTRGTYYVVADLAYSAEESNGARWGDAKIDVAALRDAMAGRGDGSVDATSG